MRAGSSIPARLGQQPLTHMNTWYLKTCANIRLNSQWIAARVSGQRTVVLLGEVKLKIRRLDLSAMNMYSGNLSGGIQVNTFLTAHTSQAALQRADDEKQQLHAELEKAVERAQQLKAEKIHAREDFAQPQ
ncbi:unnamed protein product, partial [Effrenium voratum]